jgi:hypothetical protein
MSIQDRIINLNNLILDKDDSCLRQATTSNLPLVKNPDYINPLNPMHPANATYLIQRALTEIVTEYRTPHILMCFGNDLCGEEDVGFELHLILETIGNAYPFDLFIEYMINNVITTEMLERNLKIILFQFLFTLAEIQSSYPTFRLNKISFDSILFFPTERRNLENRDFYYGQGDIYYALPQLIVADNAWEMRLNIHDLCSISGTYENLGVIASTSPKSNIREVQDQYVDMFHFGRILEYLVEINISNLPTGRRLNIPEGFKDFLQRQLFAQNYVKLGYKTLYDVTPLNQLTIANPREALSLSYFDEYVLAPIENIHEVYASVESNSFISFAKDTPINKKPNYKSTIRPLSYQCANFKPDTLSEPLLYLSPKQKDFVSPLFLYREDCNPSADGLVFEDFPNNKLQEYIDVITTYTDNDISSSLNEALLAKLSEFMEILVETRYVPQGVQYQDFIGTISAFIVYEVVTGKVPFKLDNLNTDILSIIYEIDVLDVVVYDMYAQLLHYHYQPLYNKKLNQAVKDIIELVEPREYYIEREGLVEPRGEKSLKRKSSSDISRTLKSLLAEERKSGTVSTSVSKPKISKVEIVESLTNALKGGASKQDLSEFVDLDIKSVVNRFIDQCTLDATFENSERLEYVLERLSATHPSLKTNELIDLKTKADANNCEPISRVLSKYLNKRLKVTSVVGEEDILLTPKKRRTSSVRRKSSVFAPKRPSPNATTYGISNRGSKFNAMTVKQIREYLKSQNISIPSKIRTKDKLVKFAMEQPSS